MKMRTGEWIRAILHVNYRVAVGGEMAICFSANRAQQASYLMPSSYKRSGKFGIREIRYVSYRYAVVGEMAIGFSANRAQQALHLRSYSHKSRDEFGLREIDYVNYRVAVGLLVGQGCERSELPCLSSTYYPSRP